MKTIYIVSFVRIPHEDYSETRHYVAKAVSEEEVVACVNDYFKTEEKIGKGLPGFQIGVFDEVAEGMVDTTEDGKLTYSVNVDTIEIPTSYEMYVQSRLRDFQSSAGHSKEETFADVFLSEINHQLSGKKFAEAVCREHPSIQQMFFRLVRDCFTERATAAEYSNDERNESSVKMCREVAPILQKYPLPMK